MKKLKLLVTGESRPRRRTAALLAAILVVAQPLSPAVITVDAGCALGDAIEAANTDSAVGGCASGDPGLDTVQLTGDVSLISALPALTTDIALEGSGFEIRRDDAAPDFRILRTQEPQGSSANVTLQNVTISNGRAENGGGIYHEALSLTLVNTTLTENYSTGRGGGLYIALEGYHVTLHNSTVSGNTSVSSGGGIYSGNYGCLDLIGTTVSDNVAGYRGGGIASGSYTSLELVNSTVSGNYSGDEGGAITHGYGGHFARLKNTTVIGNSASGSVGGIYFNTFGSSGLSLSNSIVASNSGFDCQHPTSVDLGGSFDSDGSCGTTPITPGVDFDLALTNNGGPTRTHKLLRGSVAKDAGVDCHHFRDQRGFLRDQPCDSGSVELGKAPLGGSIEGLRGRKVECANISTGSSVTFNLAGASAWDCEARGLVVGNGDRVEMTVNAQAEDGAAGSLIGASGQVALCGNLTTGASVTLPLESTAAWDCIDAGLVVSAGDRMLIVFKGSHP